MRYFVINLDKRRDRWDSMQTELQKQGLLEKTTRFSAVERDWQNVPLHKLSKDFCSSLLEGDKYCSIGAVGAYESHMELWNICLELDEPIVIFEDDITFTCQDFEKHLLKILNELPSEVDMVTFFPNRPVQTVVAKHQFSVQTRFPHFGAYGYYITPSFIKKVKKHMSVLQKPFDVQLKNYCRSISSTILVLQSTPYLIQTPMEKGRDSNIICRNPKKDVSSLRRLYHVEDCEHFRQKNIPFFYSNPKTTFCVDIVRVLWYNPLSHFILKKKMIIQ